MAEKKTTKAAATVKKAAAPKKCATRKCATKKATAPVEEVAAPVVEEVAAPVAEEVAAPVADSAVATLVINSENAGFRAGDVYQALAAEQKALSVAEIAKVANITELEVILGSGWLLKEGKLKGENGLIALA